MSQDIYWKLISELETTISLLHDAWPLAERPRALQDSRTRFFVALEELKASGLPFPDQLAEQVRSNFEASVGDTLQLRRIRDHFMQIANEREARGS